jgi:hypothetical protein
MFDRLWEESPMVQKTKKQSYEQGRAEGVTQGITQGVTQGEVQTLRRLLVKDVQRRFPELTELTQEKIKLCEKPDVLESLYQQVQDAADAKAVQQLLVSISEQQA